MPTVMFYEVPTAMFYEVIFTNLVHAIYTCACVVYGQLMVYCCSFTPWPWHARCSRAQPLGRKPVTVRSFPPPMPDNVSFEPLVLVPMLTPILKNACCCCCVAVARLVLSLRWLRFLPLIDLQNLDPVSPPGLFFYHYRLETGCHRVRKNDAIASMCLVCP